LPGRIIDIISITRFQMWFGMKLCRLRLQNRNAAAIIFQRLWCGFDAIKEFDLWSDAATKMQSIARRCAVHVMMSKWHRGAALFQKRARGMLVRIQLSYQRAAATDIQRIVRGMLVRNELRRHAMATMIQSLARGMFARILLSNKHAAATSIQSLVRRMVVRMELAMEKAAAQLLQRIVRDFLVRVAVERRIREQQALIEAQMLEEEEEKKRVRLENMRWLVEFAKTIVILFLMTSVLPLYMAPIA
jgi:hypothetical protein